MGEIFTLQSQCLPRFYQKCPSISVQNPTEVEDQNKNKHLFTGLYALSDEEKENIINGYKCSPSSLYELLVNYHEVGVKRIYGSKDKNLKQNVSFF